MLFECKNCQEQFNSEAIKEEYNDPIFGACWRYIATCPECGSKSKPYTRPKPQVKKTHYAAPNCGNTVNCCGGGGCGMH